MNRVMALPTPPIEIITHKDASKQVVEEAKVANEHLKNLLVENGFTIKIYSALRGKRKT